MRIVSKRDALTPPQARLRRNPFAHRSAIICNIARQTIRAPDSLEKMALAGMTIARFNLAKILTTKDRKWFLQQRSEERRVGKECRL